MFHKCVNYECNKVTTKEGGLCDDCKEEARQLEHNLKQDAKFERLQYVPKNDPRHRKGKR